MTDQIEADRRFIAAAVDFMEAGPDKFKPGYDQYRDLAIAASRLSAAPSPPVGEGEK